MATGIDVAEFSKHKSQALNGLEELGAVGVVKANDENYSTQDISQENETKFDQAIINRDVLDKENSEPEPINSNLTATNFSFSGNSDESNESLTEGQKEQTLSKSSSEISLPSRKQNNEPTVSGGGLNNLIRRMTGLGEKREQEDSAGTNSRMVEENEKSITDREDESKLEIPAFLRRQAN